MTERPGSPAYVRVGRDGFVVELAGDRDFVTGILEQVFGAGLERLAELPHASPARQPSTTPIGNDGNSGTAISRLSFNELRRSVQPTTNPELTLTAVYYLDVHLGQGGATTEEVRTLLQDQGRVKASVTKGLSTYLARAQAYGWLVRNGDKWRVTDTGSARITARLTPEEEPAQ